jgi:hypothetical protein
MGALVLHITNTFRGWQEHDSKKCARVEFAGIIASKDEADSAAPAGMKLRDGVISGHYWFSPEMLVPLETSIDQNYTISTGQGNAAGFSFTAPVRQNVSLRLIEMKAAEPQ